MEIRICKQCKRLIKYICGPELCQECMKSLPKEEEGRINNILNATLNPKIAEDERKYGQVKDYIMAHPKATIAQISETNEIAPKKFFEWIREERLEFSQDSINAWFECEKCGRKIKGGKLCNQCKSR